MIRPFFLLLLSIQLFAIIVIKPREVGEAPGVTGQVSGAFETKRGNTDTDSYSGGAELQYDNNVSTLVWGTVNAAYGKANGVKNTNNVYAHLRYIENIRTKALAGELFAQIEGDEFKSIKDRILSGGDVRARLFRPKGAWGGLFLGLGAFFEYVGYSTAVDPAEHNIRFNSYLAYTLNMANASKFTLYGYFQPEVTDVTDFYSALSAELELQIYRQLYLGFVAAHTYDSTPAAGIKKQDFYQRTYLMYKF